MNPVANLISPEDILLDLEVDNKEQVFDAVAQLWSRRHGLSQTQVVESLIAREKLGSTGLGQGVALPHARLKNLDQAVAAIVRSKEPISFDAPDRKPVFLMFVLLVPIGATEQHLKVLAQVAEMLSNWQLREKLKLSKNSEDVYQLFAGWQCY
jgi:PTS system nitrogen regulatory IIA component